MVTRSVNALLQSADETADLARAIAAELKPGDTILLSGEIGAGKSHFCRSVILDLLEEPEDVPSPTFTLVQTYDLPKSEIWHVDLYRLTSVDELAELGLDEALDTAICLVEWPDRLGDLAPSGALCLHLEMDEREGVRNLTAQSSDDRWQEVLELISDG